MSYRIHRFDPRLALDDAPSPVIKQCRGGHAAVVSSDRTCVSMPTIFDRSDKYMTPFAEFAGPTECHRLQQ